LQTFLGDDPMPAPCAGSSDTTCGRQFVDGSFGISPEAQTNPALAGLITDGVFDGGPGPAQIQLLFGSGAPVELTLQNARVHATALSATGLTNVILDGAVTQQQLGAQIAPALVSQLDGTVAADCIDLTAPPNCGCIDGSTGKTLLGLFDGDLQGTSQDCQISVAEVLGNSLIKSLLAPDICTAATCTAPDSLSLGIELSAVPATFTSPGDPPAT
jgi:hypothetical protein